MSNKNYQSSFSWENKRELTVFSQYLIMPRHMTYMCIYETALCSNEISVFKMLFLIPGNGSFVHKGDTDYIPS